MKNDSEEITCKQIEQLEAKGWIYLSDWLFFKAGKVYDLSAADLTKLEEIEENPYFVVTE